MINFGVHRPATSEWAPMTAVLVGSCCARTVRLLLRGHSDRKEYNLPIKAVAVAAVIIGLYSRLLLLWWSPKRQKRWHAGKYTCAHNEWEQRMQCQPSVPDWMRKVDHTHKADRVIIITSVHYKSIFSTDAHDTKMSFDEVLISQFFILFYCFTYNL